MALLWVRKALSGSITTAGTQLLVDTLYHNGRATAGTLSLKQKATVVATHLMFVSDQDDILTARLIVDGEAVVPVFGTYEVQDPQYKGIYPFARGPVFFSPRRLIAIPTEHKLFLQLIKESGGSATAIFGYVQVLLNLSLS